MKTGPFTDPDRLWTVVNRVITPADRGQATAVGQRLTGRTTADLAAPGFADMRDAVVFGANELICISPKPEIGFFTAMRAARQKGEIATNVFADVTRLPARAVVSVEYPSYDRPWIDHLLLPHDLPLLKIETLQHGPLCWTVDRTITNMDNLAWAVQNYAASFGAGSTA